MTFSSRVVLVFMLQWPIFFNLFIFLFFIENLHLGILHKDSEKSGAAYEMPANITVSFQRNKPSRSKKQRMRNLGRNFRA